MNFTTEDEERTKIHLNVLSNLLEAHCGLSELQKVLVNFYMDLPVEKTKTIDVLQSHVIREISEMQKMIKVTEIVKQFIKSKAELD